MKHLTHLSLPAQAKKLALMRAALLGLNLSEYITDLVQTDAANSGLVELVKAEQQKEVGHG